MFIKGRVEMVQFSREFIEILKLKASLLSDCFHLVIIDNAHLRNELLINTVNIG